MSQLLPAITQGLADEFAAVAESMVGAPAQVSVSADPIEAGWVVSCAVEGPLAGTWSVGFTKAEATSLAERVLMSPSVADNEVADALVEIAGQMVASLVTKKTIAGLAARVTGATIGTALPGKPAGGFACKLDDTLTIHIACTFDGVETAAPPPAKTPAAAAASEAAGFESGPAQNGSARALPDNLELILDIDMPLSVRFGESTMTLDALSRLGPGSLIELSRQPDDPVDVLINGRLVARGEVVVVGGNYGVRIVEVVSAAERIRTINA